MKHFIILSICSLLSITVQSKALYKLKLSRVEIVKYVKEYAEARMWMTKPTRYTNALNCELIVYNVPLDIKVRLKMHEFLSNEYRPFAINLERSLCNYMVLEYKMMIYPDLLKIRAHMPEPRCPVKPGNYSFTNLVPDIGNYPANIPFHNFMLEIGYWHGTLEILTAQFYGTLDRDAIIREQYG